MSDVVRDLFLPVAAQPTIDSIVEMSTRAEREGYERVWLPETWGRDAVTVLTTIAERTDEIGIGTSIMNVYSRSPALIGQTAATLQEASDGRFRLGLGASGPILMEGWHGVDYGNPLRRTRETIDVIRQVLEGETVQYDGEYFQLAGFRLRQGPPESAPPIDAGGMGPKSVELAGRFGQGWHALMLTPSGLADRIEDFERGSEMGEFDRSEQRVTVSVGCCALKDRERARYLSREHLAFYVGGMGTFYREAMARQGYEETANTIAQHWGNGDKEAAIDAIDDEVLDTFSAAGHPEECRERLADFEEIDGVDAVSVSFPRAADGDEIATTTKVLAAD
ncbi:TIGR04024 family LLM class F420-dependent oxidoreductase [Salinibaculum rarum]|uniref:TIGR04024 family LLM class F420-dependent oxidoreductase n=1 Tax=Salinibaculum rarum TaxID=3058903 RepID=UPI00265FDFD1|nr:TIGR04024 family LLM class F420-dependent oxidoreductase [Salinibaculum sp. KK48]